MTRVVPYALVLILGIGIGFLIRTQSDYAWPEFVPHLFWMEFLKWTGSAIIGLGLAFYAHKAGIFRESEAHSKRERYQLFKEEEMRLIRLLARLEQIAYKMMLSAEEYAQETRRLESNDPDFAGVARPFSEKSESCLDSVRARSQELHELAAEYDSCPQACDNGFQLDHWIKLKCREGLSYLTSSRDDVRVRGAQELHQVLTRITTLLEAEQEILENTSPKDNPKIYRRKKIISIE